MIKDGLVYRFFPLKRHCHFTVELCSPKVDVQAAVRRLPVPMHTILDLRSIVERVTVLGEYHRTTTVLWLWPSEKSVTVLSGLDLQEYNATLRVLVEGTFLRAYFGVVHIPPDVGGVILREHPIEDGEGIPVFIRNYDFSNNVVDDFFEESESGVFLWLDQGVNRAPIVYDESTLNLS